MLTGQSAPDVVERDGGAKAHLVRVAKLAFDPRLIDAGKTIPPTNEYTDKFGEIAYVPSDAVSHTDEYGESVASAIAARRDALAKHPLPLLLPWHGIVVVAKTLAAAFETLERVDS